MNAELRLRSILAFCGLTLHQLSLETERLYGADSPFRIPHTLYNSLTSSSFSPSLLQICALSRISGYRLLDWLDVFGVNRQLLAGLQVAMPFPRTRLIDPAFSGRELYTFEVRQEGYRPNAAVRPLGHTFHRVSSHFTCVGGPEEQRAQFATIGSEDTLSFPELLPGSIVRLDPHYKISPWQSSTADRKRPELLIVEHDGGLWCGRFRLSEQNVLYAAPEEVAYPPVVLRYPQQARILGRVDMEIRWMHRLHAPRVPSVKSRRGDPPASAAGRADPGALIRGARRRSGLTLKEASGLSRRVARAMDQRQYAIAQSTLSDYEAQNGPPRHVEKALTLCLLYGIPLMELVHAAGVDSETLGQRPIPREVFSGTNEQPAGSDPHLPPASDQVFCSSATEPFGAIPWFLESCLPELSGILHPSWRDLFRVTGDQAFLPAHTDGSVAALVDRRRKRPVHLPERPAWFQPVYMLLMRDGSYRCACCTLNDRVLQLCPNPKSEEAPEILILGADAEVVGQIVALARDIR